MIISLSRARKLVRFVAMYGPGRTLFKAAGRLRMNVPLLSFRNSTPDIGVVGCGQFAFATVGYYLMRAFGRRIATCYDADPSAQQSFEKAYGVGCPAKSFAEVLAHGSLTTLYIASNHASHADYAVAAIRRDLAVYIEKPIAVRYDQLVTLLRAIRESGARVFAGYNRPFSAAVRRLRREIVIDPAGGFSIQCFVSGHMLAADHWYRRPDEGTRICGNLGHWLDLMVHILSWRGMPNRLAVSLTIADESEPDDNMVISMSSDRGDVLSVMLTSRCEPFEGINETIHIQHGETICKIDNFQRMTIWQGERRVRKRFWPKDVGHRLAILQPFRDDLTRDWREIVQSTLLMLHITENVRGGVLASEFSFEESLDDLTQDLRHPVVVEARRASCVSSCGFTETPMR